MEALFKIKILFDESLLYQAHIFAGDWLDLFMVLITSLGDEIFYVCFLPAVYWCYNKEFCLKIGGAFLASAIANDLLKEFFAHPRPDPQKLVPGLREISLKYIPRDKFGFPSGHAQNAVAFWGAFAYLLRKKIITGICLFLIIIISYSRLYLGVHFPGDVAGGFIAGAVILLLFILALRLLDRQNMELKRSIQAAASLLIPFILFTILPGSYVPKTLGVLSGFLTGYILSRDNAEFNPRSRFLPGLFKILIGFSGLAVIRILLKYILPEAPVWDYTRYLVLGLWITLAAPYIFSRIKLLSGFASED